ncbi:zf-RVT domain-containing protein, partial [Cephalotus follicularis]
FSFKLAWETIRPSAALVPWAKVVWHSGGIPKHTFCLWLTFLKAYHTLDKLFCFGVEKSSLCPFGCGHHETVDHLFFECTFTKAVWSKVLKLKNCLPPASWNWENTATWAFEHKVGKQFRYWMRRAGLAATVYHCWRERNNRIFRQSVASSDHLRTCIMSNVSAKAALCLRIHDTPTNRSIVVNWEIEESIFHSHSSVQGYGQGA